MPSPDPRLQRRYLQLVEGHLTPLDRVAAGLRALPGTAQAFATTQAAWRFFANPRISLPQLAQPLIEAARTAVAQETHRYALVIHDWSQLHSNAHTSNQDRAELSRSTDLGYDLLTALVLSDRDGAPMAPVCQRRRAADGVYSSRSVRRQPVPSQLDAVAPTLRVVAGLKWGKPTVHIIDREADSVAPYRRWHRHGRLFLVRADAERVVRPEGHDRTLPTVVARLHQQRAFRPSRSVLFHGRPAEQFVAEAAVTRARPARPHRVGHSGPRPLVRGQPLPLRLVVSEVRSPDGDVLATWYLLSNLPSPVSASEVALWYYWRWRVESDFKLLKGAGLQVEQWQQETALAVAKRLLVASLACVVVWRLARIEDPEAAEVRQVLGRLSGRFVNRGQEYTEPALRAGLWVLLSVTRLLESYDVHDLFRRARVALPTNDPLERPPNGPV